MVCRCWKRQAGGGVAAARRGTLQLLVGGEARVVAQHRDLLESVGRVRHVGGYGAGYIVKLLINLLWFGQAVAVAEALLLGRAAGLDLGVLRDALAGSAADSRFIRDDLPALFAGDFMQTFGLDRCYEELQIVTGLARGHHVPFQVSEAVADIYLRALRRYGPADGELLAMALLEEQAGLSLRHSPAGTRPGQPCVPPPVGADHTEDIPANLDRAGAARARKLDLVRVAAWPGPLPPCGSAGDPGEGRCAGG